MPSNPKLYITNEVRFVTTSLQSGLPFLPNNFMKNLVVSYLAKSQNLFPVTICAFVLMQNHIHILLKVKAPKDLARFLNYFKTNTAHALNTLKGIPKGSVWEKGSDSPVVLDIQALKERLIYMFSNPLKANVCSKIEEYKNLNTYNIIKNERGIGKMLGYKINRTLIPVVNKLKERKDKNYYEKINKSVFSFCKKIFFEVSLLEAFNGLSHTTSMSYEEFLEDIILSMQESEEYYKDKRIEEKISLKKEIKSIFVNFIPKREKSHKMICLASDKDLRNAFIERFKYLVSLARNAYRKWRDENTIKFYPVGFFLPSHYPIGYRESIFV